MNKQRLFALLLAAVMSVSGSVTAFAEGEGTTPPADATVTAPDGTTGEDTDTTETEGNTTTEPGTGDTENEDETGTDDPSEEENADGNDEGDTPEADTPTTETPEASVSNELTQTMADTKELDIVDGVATVETPEDLKKALDMGNDEVSTIVLGANITASITIPKGRTVVLDLGEYTLTNVTQHTIMNYGELTIIGDGTVVNNANEGQAVYNDMDAEAILNSGHFTKDGVHGYTILNHGVMEINDGVQVTTWSGTHSSLVENGWQDGSKNTSQENSELTINGGTFSGGLNTVKNDDWGELVINDGVFENTTQASLLNWNVATINGGNFETNSDSGVILNGYLNSSTDQGKLVITGGSFKNETGKGVVAPMNKTWNKETTTVSGGVFHNAITEGVAQATIDAGSAQVKQTANSGVSYRIGEDAVSFTAEEDAVVEVIDAANQNLQIAGTNVTVKNETGAPITINNSTVADGGNVVVNKTSSSSRDNDSDYYGNETWDDVKDQIADADEGDTIKISGSGLRSFPASVARELKGKDITLEIRKNGVTYKVNGLEIGAIDKIWYEFDELDQLLTADASDKQDEADKPQTDSTVKENPATGR